MSLFAVLKYPISVPPTVEQLRRLPVELLDKWIGESDWKNKGTHVGDKCTMIGEWYETFYSRPTTKIVDIRDVELLRRMVREYDE